jgi:hypothetical protein
VRKVWATLRREGLRVSRTRVWALMHAHGLVLVREAEPGGPPPRGHGVVPDPNRRWATDLTTVWTRREGWGAVVPTIDCGCRSVLALEVTTDQSAPAVLRALDALLVEQFGTAAAVPAGLQLKIAPGVAARQIAHPAASAVVHPARQFAADPAASFFPRRSSCTTRALGSPNTPLIPARGRKPGNRYRSTNRRRRPIASSCQLFAASTTAQTVAAHGFP